jgi:hypothetical protein
LIDGEVLNDGNKGMYRETLTGIMNCYNVSNKADKAAETKKMIDSLK